MGGIRSYLGLVASNAIALIILGRATVACGIAIGIGCAGRVGGCDTGGAKHGYAVRRYVLLGIANAVGQ